MNATELKARSAIVVGGSLGGLLAANLLQRQGWTVTVLERTPQALSGRGAGIVTHPELLEVLEAAGAQVDHRIGVKVDSRATLAQDGSVVMHRALPQTLTAWGTLYHLLKQAFEGEYRVGAHVLAVKDSETGATVSLEDGTSLQADLVVAADGFRSALREQLLPDVQLQYAGYIAWRGLVDELVLSEEARTMLFDKFSFCLPPREQILGYPVAGQGNSTEPGERRFNFVWYRATSEVDALPDMLTDSTGKLWNGGIPPTLIRTDVLADMEAAAEDLLAPQFAEAVRKTQLPLFQPIYDLEVPRMDFGHVALLGDAAFVARPHCGMGVTKAASDAFALAKAMTAHDDVVAAVRAYSDERVPIGKAIVQHARHLGAYMQAQLRDEGERAMAERYRTPDAVMRETAVARSF